MADHDTGVSLVATRVLLRTPRLSMAPQLFAYLTANDERFAPIGPKRNEPLSMEEAKRSIENSSRDYEEGKSVRFFVFLEGNDAIIGDISLTNIVRGVFRACHLGYGIDGAYEGKGYMREALSCVLRYAFDELKMHRVMANYIPTNERSGALLRRLGFSVEGYARDYLFLNGEWKDHVLTSLIEQER
ncbi:GNAT family N-acetyltransferase [Piscinibacter gummiphilus]|uniref:GNAT family N-acetyltransferase n=1 Tax=Piscinibacter gummiphilus TaxID=946333 RepID=A0ABZ0D2D1_9BURK|nr:GNAT family N-acetyltransferase [Piscinibacter gummiphilus]WOB11348.1 GNAT family N-acetyltransferase [Piscinibacter gummiphilus]